MCGLLVVHFMWCDVLKIYLTCTTFIEMYQTEKTMVHARTIELYIFEGQNLSYMKHASKIMRRPASLQVAALQYWSRYTTEQKFLDKNLVGGSNGHSIFSCGACYIKISYDCSIQLNCPIICSWPVDRLLLNAKLKCKQWLIVVLEW